MACHSKWANIKHRKTARCKIFTKLIHEIAIAAGMRCGDGFMMPLNEAEA